MSEPRVARSFLAHRQREHPPARRPDVDRDRLGPRRAATWPARTSSRSRKSRGVDARTGGDRHRASPAARRSSRSTCPRTTSSGSCASPGRWPRATAAWSLPGASLPHPRNNGAFAAASSRATFASDRPSRSSRRSGRMTSLPAQVFGLTGRGEIREGAFADVVDLRSGQGRRSRHLPEPAPDCRGDRLGRSSTARSLAVKASSPACWRERCSARVSKGRATARLLVAPFFRRRLSSVSTRLTCRHEFGYPDEGALRLRGRRITAMRDAMKECPHAGTSSSTHPGASSSVKPRSVRARSPLAATVFSTACLSLPPSLPQPSQSGIEHIVVVTMENRSFDHYLGWLERRRWPPGRTDVRRSGGRRACRPTGWRPTSRGAAIPTPITRMTEAGSNTTAAPAMAGCAPGRTTNTRSATTRTTTCRFTPAPRATGPSAIAISRRSWRPPSRTAFTARGADGSSRQHLRR